MRRKNEPGGACGPRQIQIIWSENNENIFGIEGDVVH